MYRRWWHTQWQWPGWGRLAAWNHTHSRSCRPRTTWRWNTCKLHMRQWVRRKAPGQDILAVHTAVQASLTGSISQHKPHFWNPADSFFKLPIRKLVGWACETILTFQWKLSQMAAHLPVKWSLQAPWTCKQNPPTVTISITQCDTLLSLQSHLPLMMAPGQGCCFL